MSNTAFLYNAPSGVPGDITRRDNSVVEQGMLGTPAADAYGVPVKVSAGKFIPFAGGEVAADFYGVLARSVPGISGSLTEDFSTDVPYTKVPQDIMIRGYINVKCITGTPARGGAVYARIVAATGRPIGAFEAVSDSSNSILLTNATWASTGKDADNNAELSVRMEK